MNYADNQIAGAAYGSSGQVPQQHPDVSPFVAMGNAVNDVAILCQRVRQLADRLTGSVPTPIESGNAKQGTAIQPPVFHALRITADAMQSEVNDSLRAIDRIERALP